MPNNASARKHLPAKYNANKVSPVGIVHGACKSVQNPKSVLPYPTPVTMIDRKKLMNMECFTEPLYVITVK